MHIVTGEQSRPVPPHDIDGGAFQRWLDKLPPFSPILRRVLASISMNPDDISIPKLAEIIENDTVIAGKVLGISNSVLYNRGRPVCSLRDAVVRLGLNRLRNVILSLSINRVWGGFVSYSPFSILRFNQHALAAGVMADLLATRLRIDDPDAAFVAGLFHDVGQLYLVNQWPKEYWALLSSAMEEGELENRERELAHASHAEFSARAVAQWNLPERVQYAIRLHEQPTSTNIDLRDIVHIADRYVTAMGFSVLDRPSGDLAAQAILEPLGISETDIGDDFMCNFKVLADMPATRAV